jgi:small subunit ribosomal protein S20
MPNLKSAKKELRKSKSRSAYNAKIENNVKTLVKKSRKAMDGKDESASELLGKTLKALDKAVQKGIIKKNTRDRKKSRLQIKFNKSKK